MIWETAPDLSPGWRLRLRPVSQTFQNRRGSGPMRNASACSMQSPSSSSRSRTAPPCCWCWTTCTGPTGGASFGISVAVSGDTAVVGAYLEDAGGSGAGAAYVFQEPAPTPTPTPVLTPTATPFLLTFNVNSTVDAVDAVPGNVICATAGAVCTLRAAIQEANALAVPSITINVPAGTYTLTIAGNSEASSVTGDLDIIRDLSIVGAGADVTTVAQITNDRVFDIVDLLGAINVGISGLTIADGAPPAGQDGAGIQNVANLTLVDTTITNNAAVAGGAGIVNTGTTTLTNSIVKDNAAGAPGGGIKNSGDMTINNSTVSGNTGSSAAGIFNSFGSLAVSNSAVHDNTVTGSGAGGGIGHVGASATLTLSNVTISGNTSGAAGGGLFINTTGNVTLNNVTITDNVAPGGGGGIATTSTVVTLKNTIVAGNAGGGSGDDCGFGDIITSLGHNLDSDGSCGFAATGDISSTDPLLGPLTDNTGPTLTHAIHGVSPATDAGNPATPGSGGDACEPVDQRKVARPIDGDLNTAAICDIGAFEATGSPTAGGDRLVLSFDGNLTVTVPALSLANAPCPVEAVLDAPLGPVVTNGMGKEERTFTIDFLSGWAFCPGPLSLGSSITSGGLIVEQVDTTPGLDFPADMTVTLCLKIDTLEVTGLGELQNCPDGFTLGQKSPIILNCTLFSFTSFTCTIDTGAGAPEFFNDLATPVAEVNSGSVSLTEIQPAVGGIAQPPRLDGGQADVDTAPLESPGSSGIGVGSSIAVGLAIAAGAAILGGVTWYVRKRRLP